ncbi:hypothetical protein PR202_gb22042 [Eleusine coracana subsp. coracana]|uniref:DUF3615 domain-containing protein n=1 Tax=Eleusine coracana subsp. coracana TaxID=191504 RepID=A0AAV5FFK0_ELECO|nr:hypothetical protein PR202_gb22042 [Eleusine coracana subsp. coracana]
MKLKETDELLQPSNSKPPCIPVFQQGSRELADSEARSNQNLLDEADRLERRDDEELCDTKEAKVAFRAFKAKFTSFYRDLAPPPPPPPDTDKPLYSNVPRPRDTQEEHLTAEEMEMKADSSGWLLCPQARHFSMLALEHYNASKKVYKFEMGRVLLSKCFSETDGTTFGHVNFTAIPKHLPMAKRLFFAELMLIPDLQAYDSAEPMRVLHSSSNGADIIANRGVGALLGDSITNQGLRLPMAPGST